MTATDEHAQEHNAYFHVVIKVAKIVNQPYCLGVHFTLVQNMLVMVPGEMWGFKGRIFGAGTM